MRHTNQDLSSQKRRPRTRPQRSTGPTRRSFPLRLEQLEPRVVPTTVILTPSKDNTLYESTTGDTSNGAGANFFVGVTNQASIRRGVIEFNIAGNIPAGATINSVSLSLHVSQTQAGAETIELHRLLADWGESTSNADGSGGGGRGAPAASNDATWLFRFFNTSRWTNAGGDFTSTISASASVGGVGSYTWGSTTQLVADVQSWLNTPSNNFGWILLGDETTQQSAKRFDSKENATAANRPTLTIDYTAGFTPISISGQVYNDLNGNAAKDSGESGLQGWTVFLDTNNNGTLDSGEPSTTSDANGNYTFSGLGQGTYRIREVVQSGWLQTTANPADVIAQSGVNVTGKDFGVFRQIAISGQVFNDTNGNGAKDTSEAGLQGWTVFLDTNNNGTLDSGEPNTSSDANGNYSFSNLGPGTYRVRQVIQAGWVQSTATPTDIVAQSGTNATGRDFGNFQRVTISGQVFNDRNGDGTKQARDPGLAGWTVFLDTNNNGTLDSGEPSTTSVASGNFTFSGLGPGTYHIREVLPSNWAQTTANPADVVPTSGTNVSGILFGLFGRFSINGQVYNDLNGSAVKESGEPGLQGWTIFLDTNNNGTLDTGESSTTTDASGTFSLANLGPGTYHVRQVLQTGWVRTTTSPADIVGSSGFTIQGMNFGDFRLITINGVVFHDLNGNGIKEASETGLQNWTVFLDTNNNGSLDSGEPSISTDANGAYSFGNLGPGTYHVRQVLQTGWVATVASPVDVVASSGTNSTVNLGNAHPGIAGLVFDDRNGNGTLDTSEPGLQGWTVFLDTNNNGTLDTGETSVTTNAEGGYGFLDLAAGSYTVREVLQTGWQQSKPTGPGFSYSVTLTSGQLVAGRDFGNFRQGQIGGVVFEDANGNAAKDSGEPVLQGWPVFLDTNNNGTLDNGEPSTITGANGTYSFSGLNPGTYVVREVVQTGWQQIRPGVPGLGYTITLVSGQSLTDRDFGNFRPGEIHGVVFNDQNNNRAHDTGEPGLSGWVVYLDQNNNGVLDQRTLTATAADVPRPIPDLSTITSTLALSNITSVLLNVSVTLSIQHTWDADLDVYLISPAGTRVLLFSGVGGSGHDFTNTVLDDAAAGTITAGSAPFTGSFRPQGLLSVLVGQSANGTWALEVTDTAAPDPGTLLSWSLALSLANEPVSVSDATGAYAFLNLTPGTYQVREVVRPGWTQTLPGDPDFRYNVTLASGQKLNNEDFGNKSNNLPGPLVKHGSGALGFVMQQTVALVELQVPVAFLSGTENAGLVRNPVLADRFTWRRDTANPAFSVASALGRARIAFVTYMESSLHEQAIDQLFSELDGDLMVVF